VRPPLPRGPYLVVGLGRSGVAASLALRSAAERVIGIDRVATSAATASQLRDAGVEIHTGPDGSELLERVHCVVKSPGVPREAPVIANALERRVTVIGELELAWRMLEQPFIAVTGTNGKTTTVELIGAIYRAAGLAVEVAGNVGRALSELALAPLAPGTTIVCEASSFQLEDTLEFAPEAAVLLNLTADHLDRHRTIERYRDAKLRIFANQPAGSTAVLPDVLVCAGMTGPGVPDEPLAIPGGGEQVLFGSTKRCALRLRDGVLHWHDQELIPAGALGARGPLANSMAAAAVTLARGAPIEAVREVLANFKGVAHRLEQVATIDGVLYVNDSKATNVASTLVALDAFAAGSVLLILGGRGKGQDFGALREAVAERAAHTYLIGEDAERIAAALGGLPLTSAGTLERAVELARAASAPGMVVLLSPACASFDQFSDFEARGGAFTALVRGEG
jgi:UDP-N-acetylmuramoylalanine--D-glutamate ligase